MKPAFLAALAVTVVAGCASQPHSHSYRGSADETAVVEVQHHYVPMMYTPQAAWGEHRFVPGYARQGVIVTPSRTWTYGQGPGFRATGDIDMRQMTGAGPRPCEAIKPVSRAERIRLGRVYAGMTYGEVMNQPLNYAESAKIAEYRQSGCDPQQYEMQVRSDRWDGVLAARELQSGEKGGSHAPGSHDDAALPSYEEPPEGTRGDQFESQDTADASQAIGATAVPGLSRPAPQIIEITNTPEKTD